MQLLRKSQPLAFTFLVLIFAAAACGTAAVQSSISAEPNTPFKLATFDAGGGMRVGLVLGDETVLDIQAANAHLVENEGLGQIAIPGEMRVLIEEYATVGPRLYQMANHFKDAELDTLSFAHGLDDVSIKAPIKYPYNLLAAAANYQDHSAEMARRYGTADPKPVNPDEVEPTFFAKSPRSCIIDPGEAFRIPPGRNIDWEGELAVVIGKPAKNLTLENAHDYIFGYSIIFDVSDRGSSEGGGWSRGGGQGRGQSGGSGGGGGFNFGVNWFRGKSRDGAAPFGPFIVPKEFIPDAANLRLVTKINGVVKQDGNTKDMIHNEAYQLRHLTNILTLYPGDVVSTGTPAGVGSARNPPEFVQPGDVVTIEIEGIGTLVTPIEKGS